MNFYLKQRRWVLLFAFLVCVLTSLPYAVAAFNQGVDWEFSGFLFGVEDGNSYIAKMLRGAQGEWLFRSPYSAQLQAGALLYLPYLLFGKLLGPSAQHAHLVLLLHFFRLASIFAQCLATYDFLSLFLQAANLRRLGTALAILGGGLGWLLPIFGLGDLLGSMPLDFFSPEAFGFLAVFGLPHLVLSRALLLWGLLFFLRPTLGQHWQNSLLWLTLALVHAITAALGLIIIGAYLVILLFLRRKKEISTHGSQALPAAMGAGPILVINLLQYLRDPYLQEWATQNRILSPHPVHYLLAWGLLLPFAFFGLRYLFRKNQSHAVFLSAWLGLLPLLLYAPLGLQRRFAEGAWVLLIALALVVFEQDLWREKGRILWLFGLTIPTTAILFIGSFQAAANPAAPAFRPTAETAAFGNLRSTSNSGELVLAAYQTGNALPAWAPLRVLIGHGPETVGFGELAQRVARFYDDGATEENRLELLTEHAIDYVFWGPAERNLGSWSPIQSGYLDLVFESEGYSVFRVINE